jgi:hypothetical protein
MSDANSSSSSGKDGNAALSAALESISKDYDEIEGGSEMIRKISQKFGRIFDNPPREEFEVLLGKSFSENEVRVALFQPLEEQFKYFPLILMNTTGAPETSPLGKCRHLVLSLAFLVHRSVCSLFPRPHCNAQCISSHRFALLRFAPHRFASLCTALHRFAPLRIAL